MTLNFFLAATTFFHYYQTPPSPIHVFSDQEKMSSETHFNKKQILEKGNWLDEEIGSNTGYNPAHFIEMLYRQMQVDLSSESEFISIPFEQLKPGDLLFGGQNEKDVEMLGFYLGEGEFIHVTPIDKDHTIIKENLAECAWPFLIAKTFPQSNFQSSIQKNQSNEDQPKENLKVVEEIDTYQFYFINEEKLPLVISPTLESSPYSFQEWLNNHKEEILSKLSENGALLLRGFPVESADDFSSVVTSILGAPIDYKGEGSRTKVAKGVYTSTEAPPNFHIPLHNELSCTDSPSSYICFYCDVAPPEGSGQTLLGRTKIITEALKKQPDVWELFEGKTLRYISRHPSKGHAIQLINNTHKSWQDAFETDDKLEVERICNEMGFEYKWDGDWIEVTRHTLATRGPDTYFDFVYWFNQAHLYHFNPRLYGGWVNYLLAGAIYFEPSSRPYDITFENGEPIPREMMYKIYNTLEQNTIFFDWKTHDVLLLDNIKILHGKAPYTTGSRRILVSLVD